MPVDINRLTEGWLELESDPGLFTLLLEDFGVKGVQVEEIYDLQKSLEGPVYGFIFLFRWIEERRSRRKVVDQSETFVKDEEVVNNIFFAQQMVPNSCATHALLSVLLNCPNIHLGATLSRLKAHTSGMCPENKGWAIGNTPELAKAHNSHAMPQAKRRLDKSSGVSTGRYTGEAFHFVSYVPIHGKLFELDGLKPFPMDHGPWGDKEDWTEKFRRVITDRLGIATGEQYHDIRFNLMAVVPDRRLALVHKLKMLKTNRQIVLEALQQLVKLTHPELTGKDDETKKEANSPNSEVSRREGSKLNCEKIKINGVIESDSCKSVKQNHDESDSYGSSRPILETQSYTKIQLEPASEFENITQETKSEAQEERSDGDNDRGESTASPGSCTSKNTSETNSDQISSSNSPSASDQTSAPLSSSSYSSANSPKTSTTPTVGVMQPPPSADSSGQSVSETAATKSSSNSGCVPVPTSQVPSAGVAACASPKQAPASQPTSVSLVGSSQPASSHSPSVPPNHTVSAVTSNSQPHGTTCIVVQSTPPTALLCPPGPPDYSTPLTIQTSPAPSTSSTDTSSEVGSAFNSPTQGWGWNSGQSSPTSTKDFKKFVVIRVAGSGEEKVDSPSARMISNINANGKRLSNEVANATKRVCLENGQRAWEKEIDKSLSSSREASSISAPQRGNTAETELSTDDKKIDTKICSKYPELFEPHTFAPKDLLALLKNLENEISVCEMNLRDENEKRKKYKIDDCRRTHNYDEFICTFLSMLAQQGKLADLVQQHLLLKKPGLPVPRVQRPAKKPETRPSPSRRRRGRTKYRKRK